MNKVLVIDDSISVRQQVRAVLTQAAGYLLIEACDGIDGLAKLEATPDVGLIIADINMPRMNGLEMLEKLNGDTRNRAVPVLMLTSEGDPGLIVRAKRAGVKAWVVKPFKPAMLLAAVRKVIGDVPAGGAGDTPRST
jgi:two-component system, chemotaxis family, chemotaxis protein CheY